MHLISWRGTHCRNDHECDSILLMQSLVKGRTGHFFLGAGTGEIPADIQATVKLQLLALLLFSTLKSAHRLAAAFGGGDGDYSADEAAEALLPGPHAALRCLIRLDAGDTRSAHSLHALMSMCLVCK